MAGAVVAVIAVRHRGQGAHSAGQQRDREGGNDVAGGPWTR